LIFSSRQPPFANDAGTPAAGHYKKQDGQSECGQRTSALMKTKSHQAQL